MCDEVMKQIPIRQGRRLERGETYFDLDNPPRGPLMATGDEQPPHDRTYACRADLTERAWAQLVTWGQPVDEDQGQALQASENSLGISL
jgi:hypothetical protein